MDDVTDVKLGHRYAARVRHRLVAPNLDLTVTRATGFTGGQSVHQDGEIIETVTILSEARQTVKAFRREAGTLGRPLSGRQWKRARRHLKREGLL